MAQCKQFSLNGYVMHADRGVKNLVIDQYELGRGEETSNLGRILYMNYRCKCGCVDVCSNVFIRQK